MFKKFLAFLVLILSIFFIAKFAFISRNEKQFHHEISQNFYGDESPRSTGNTAIDFDNITQPIVYKDTVTSIYTIRTGPQTIYDYQSNGVPQQIWQDPNNPDNIHATFMVNKTPRWPAADRRCYYVFSSDGGTTWTDYGPINLSESGFCVCSGLSDGSAVIGMHTSAGTPPLRFQLFADVAPGAGTFTRLDPGLVSSQPALWPRIMPTSSLSNPRKVVTLSSISIGDSSTAFNHALSVTSSYWSGFQGFADAKDAETYSFARANDGRIGCAYVANYTSVPGNLGDVHYIVTTDDGLSWSSPQKIYNAPPYLDGVFGCLRGLSLTFLGTTPKVAFELMGMTPTGFYPNARAAIGFWSPNVNGGAAYVTAFDSTWSQNGNGGATDAYTSICRPSIAKSTDDNVLLIGFCVSRPDTDAIGSHYYDIYFSCSTTGGEGWKYPPTRITNFSGPL